MPQPRPIGGVVPVMLTPFTEAGGIDWDGYSALIDWYLANGAGALFAVCQSSEMQHLTLEERVALAHVAVEKTKGRVPVLASGHISDALEDQLAELRAVGETGIDVLVMVTNRLAGPEDGDDVLLAAMRTLMDGLPADLPLGLYECPAPYRRLLSDDHIRFSADSGRFVALKDVACDLATVTRRVGIAAGSPFAVVNANAAIAWDAVRAGSTGFCGIANNFHPDLYAWLIEHGADHPDLARDLAAFLALAGMIETQGYPAVAKLHHRRLGTFGSIRCRSLTYEILERHWALEPLLDELVAGADGFRARIRAL